MAVPQPKISVVILNFNGQAWLPRCLESLQAQTIFRDIEIIVSDNASTDGSDRFIEGWLAQTQKGLLVRNQTNLFFCEGNNVGAAVAKGEFLLFLNFDLWLEPACLEELYEEVKSANADAATPLVLNYDDDTFQNCGSPGPDVFGIPTHMPPPPKTKDAFVACGCSLMIRTELFRKIGGFPKEFLMYAEETDLCWRAWIAGGKVVTVPAARLHHRGAVSVNPEGQTKTVESRTSETKRYLATRNGILCLLKNSQHILLLLLIPHFLLLAVEAAASLLFVRRWSYVRKAYFSAAADAFRMMPQMREWRRKIRGFRKRSDWWMLRFLRLRPSRWEEVKRFFAMGAPKVDAK